MDSSDGQKLPPYFFFITMARRLRDAGVRIDTEIVIDENCESKPSETEERISVNLDFLSRLEARNHALKSTLH